MCLIIHFSAFDISKNFMMVMGMGIGNSGIGKKWEWAPSLFGRGPQCCLCPPPLLGRFKCHILIRPVNNSQMITQEHVKTHLPTARSHRSNTTATSAAAYSLSAPRMVGKEVIMERT